jgi:outer membrane receptor protein involved in Fe transport
MNTRPSLRTRLGAPHRRWILLIAVLANAGAALRAQSVTGADVGEEPVYELSPFVVDASRDYGYLSTNSTSGTALNTALKDLPMTVQVINSEFIRDIGATDLSEALSYASGVFTTDFAAPTGGGGSNPNRGLGSSERSASAGSGNRFSNVVTIRGFNVPFQNRMGFRYGGTVITPTSNLALGGLLDSVNIERMEVVKGPNSLLYGIGVISGIVNVIPQRPQPKAHAEFGFRMGSHGFQRTTADITGPLLRTRNHALNYRLVGSLEEREDWTDYRTKDQDYLGLQLDYSWKRTLNLFVEYQYGYSRFGGTGAQWIYDDLDRAFLPGFRNEWDEQYNYSQSGDVAGLTPVRFERNRLGRPEAFMDEPNPAARVLNGQNLGDGHRISGPDTYQQRREHNYLMNLEWYPRPDLTFSAGMFYTSSAEEEFAVNVRHFNNQANNFIIRNNLPLNFNDLEKSEFAHLLWAVSNPIAPQFAANYDITRVNGQDDIKLTRYWWSLRPRATDSLQWRARVNYNFEADLPVVGATRHNLLTGYHFINDRVDFLDGTENANRAFIERDHPYVSSGLIPAADASTRDALYFRSIDDFSVMRYNGENLAMPGTRFRNQDITFHGAYLIYQLKLFDDRLEFLGGLRYDRYNATTSTYDRISPEEKAIGLAETRYVDNPYNRTYGFSESFRNFAQDVDAWSKTFAVNYDINPSLTAYALYSEGISPNTALVDGNNRTIPAENTISREIGLKWELFDGRLSGSLAIYQIKRNNAIWDFDSAPAPAKWLGSPSVPSTHIYSGSEFNPNPTNGYLLNYGVDAFFIDQMLRTLRTTHFVTASATDRPGRSKVWYLEDPVTKQLTELTALFDIENHSAGSRQPFNRRDVWWLDYDKLDDKQRVTVHVADPNGSVVGPGGQRYSLQTVDIHWRAFIEEAFNARELSSLNPGQFDPIRYISTANPDGTNSGGNNPSASASSADGDTFVTFSDETTGFDLETIYSPRRNWQIVFNYAYTQRKARGAFGMVDFQDLATGKLFAGTEYDNVVRIFGREAFGITSEDTDGDGVPDRFLDSRGNPLSQSNPLLPSEAVSGIDGLSLFFNPQHEASLLSKYTFTEGWLENVAFTVGVKYQGSSPTSIPIGGRNLGSNLFPTPDVPDRWTFDAGLFYTWQKGRYKWRLSLNVYNLTNDRISQNTVSYTDPYSGESVSKRTRILHAPRQYRAGLTLDF